MKKIHLIMLSTFIIGGMLLNIESRDILSYAQEKVDRNIILCWFHRIRWLMILDPQI